MYTYPSVTINYMTFTAKRWGQFPTITYVDGTTDTVPVTAGHEVVAVASDLSDITVRIEPSASTNLQIKTAILNWDGTTDSLYPRDLISISIAGGHTTDANTAVSAQALSGAAQTAIPSGPVAGTVSRAVTRDANGFLASSTTTDTELGYVHGVTSAIQTQIDGKQASGSYEVATNKDTATSLGTSDTKYPSQKAVKAYADALPVVSVLAADPGTPTEGQVWYNTTTHLLKFYDGSTIQTVAHV